MTQRNVEARGNSPDSPGALWLGNAACAEFRGLFDAIGHLGWVRAFARLAEARAWIQDEQAAVPWVMVVAESYPCEFLPHDWTELHREAPLSPIVHVVGSWCQRNATCMRSWPVCLRIPWHQAEGFARRELQRLYAGVSGALSQPATATIEDQAMLAPPRPPRRILSTGINAPRKPARDALIDACRAAGHLAVSASIAEMLAPGFDAVIVARNSWSSELAAMCHRLADQNPRCLVALILGFPRPEDMAEAQQAGARVVLGAPYCLDDLIDALNALATSPVLTGCRELT